MSLSLSRQERIVIFFFFLRTIRSRTFSVAPHTRIDVWRASRFRRSKCTGTGRLRHRFLVQSPVSLRRRFKAVVLLAGRRHFHFEASVIRIYSKGKKNRMNHTLTDPILNTSWCWCNRSEIHIYEWKWFFGKNVPQSLMSQEIFGEYLPRRKFIN